MDKGNSGAGKECEESNPWGRRSSISCAVPALLSEDWGDFGCPTHSKLLFPPSIFFNFFFPPAPEDCPHFLLHKEATCEHISKAFSASGAPFSIKGVHFGKGSNTSSPGGFCCSVVCLTFSKTHSCHPKSACAAPGRAPASPSLNPDWVWTLLLSVQPLGFSTKMCQAVRLGAINGFFGHCFGTGRWPQVCQEQFCEECCDTLLTPAQCHLHPATLPSPQMGFLSKFSLLCLVLRSPMPSSSSPSFATLPFLLVLQVFNHH